MLRSQSRGTGKGLALALTMAVGAVGCGSRDGGTGAGAGRSSSAGASAGAAIGAGASGGGAGTGASGMGAGASGSGTTTTGTTTTGATTTGTSTTGTSTTGAGASGMITSGAGTGESPVSDGGPPLGVTGNSWYVLKGAPGTRTSACTAAGTTWTNAWGEMDQINWSCVQPGDTVWLAGGAYTNGFVVGASGTAGKPIYVARVLSTDTAATRAAGWSAAFDSQVVVSNATANNASPGCNAGDVLCFNQTTLGNYTVWDGRVDSGILLQTSNLAGLSPTNNTSLGQSAADIGTASGIPGTGSNHDITFDNVDFAGPAGSAEYVHKSYNAAIQVLNVTGNVVFTNCRIHGANNNVNISGSSGVTFDHCQFYDNVAGNGSAGHGNMVQYAGNDNITFRYNEWWNWSVEGIMVWTPSKALYVYGNVFHDADNSGYPSVIQANNTTAGPLFFYNNTIANVSGYCVFRPANAIGWTTDSQARNNLYWNSDVCVQVAPSSDYDAYYDDLASMNQSKLGISETTTVAQAEAHSAELSPTPFVAEPTGDFHLTANTPGGQDVGAPYNVDKDGNPRTTWTRGAYEYHP
jgi:parallel beta helix pectate lyase-like protein